jgi:hypothetical protein
MNAHATSAPHVRRHPAVTGARAPTRGGTARCSPGARAGASRARARPTRSTARGSRKSTASSFSMWSSSSRCSPANVRCSGGLRPLRPAALAWAVATSAAGIALTFAGVSLAAGAAFLTAAILAATGLRMFEPPAHEPRTRGVHHRFPTFVRSNCWPSPPSRSTCSPAWERRQTRRPWSRDRRAPVPDGPSRGDGEAGAAASSSAISANPNTNAEGD